jgi:hypothetical protein
VGDRQPKPLLIPMKLRKIRRAQECRGWWGNPDSGWDLCIKGSVSPSQRSDFIPRQQKITEELVVGSWPGQKIGYSGM